MERQLTLPGLQGALDRLPIAQSLALATRQAQTLFGINDIGQARMKRFAKGHNCIVSYTDGCVVFIKVPAK